MRPSSLAQRQSGAGRQAHQGLKRPIISNSLGDAVTACERAVPHLSFRSTMSATPYHRTGRAADALRTVRITRGYTIHAEGSVLIEFGHTRVLCTASGEASAVS